MMRGRGQEQFVLSAYLDAAMGHAEYDKLEDGSFAGRIPDCLGVVAFGDSLSDCAFELRSTLEDWLLLGLKLGHILPAIDGIDLNGAPNYEPMEPVQA